MSQLVIDASVAMAWCFEDEANDESDAILDQVVSDGAVVPVLWTQEVANVLLVAERRWRVTEAQSAQFTTLLSQLPIVVAPEWPSPSVLVTLARSHQLTGYDAAYLWLAETRGLPLASLDARLRAACRAAGVALLPG